MIQARYNPDWDFLGYFVHIDQWSANDRLNEIGDWGREHKIDRFIYDIGLQNSNDKFIVRVPTQELALEFLLTFG